MLTQHLIRTLHQEILEDFEAKRITEQERDKRFLILHEKAERWGLEYEIDSKLVPVRHVSKNTLTWEKMFVQPMPSGQSIIMTVNLDDMDTFIFKDSGYYST